MPITRKEVLERIKEQEAKGEFDVHVDPPNMDIALPVTEKFQYIKKGFNKIKIGFQKAFIVKPFIRHINKKVVHTTVVGKENLTGIKSAIVTCNHVYMFDCLVAKWAVKPHEMYITAAPFNNQKGFLGEMMRAGGMMPMSEDLHVMKKFGNAIGTYLKKKKFVMFYPEQAMWWMYEKPRPMKIGAFHYAMKYNVPVVPLFITYTKTGKYDEEGIEMKDFTIHILKPIYADPKLDRNANMERMRQLNYMEWVETYEKFYGKKLKYDIDEKLVKKDVAV